MSLWRDELKPAPAATAALVALAVVATGSMAQVVRWPQSLAWTLPALAIGAAFAFGFGHRSLGGGLGLLTLLTVGTLPPLFAHSAPTAGGFRAVGRLVAAGLRDGSQATPPVGAEPKYAVLLWVSFVVLGFLGAAWMVVRRPVGAVVSALGVVTFAGAVGDGSGRSVYAAAAVVATVGFFLAEGRQRIARWAGGRLRLPAFFGLPTLALASLAGVAAPTIFGDGPVVQLNGVLRPRVIIIKPLSDIRRQLKIEPPIEVMTVTAPLPTYWRLASLDSYDGTEWVLDAHPIDVVGGELPKPRPAPTGRTLDQTYRLTSLLSPWLPAAYAAEYVEAATAHVQIDRPSQTLLLRDATTPGLTYTVRSVVPHVSADELGPKHPYHDPYSSTFGAIARPIVAGATTQLDEARRLVAWFHTFRYSENVAAGHSVARLEQFLRDRTGYCEQFAATMTLMLRGLGVEARVGVGFLPGTLLGDQYVVSTREAHAWVEANIPGAGWTIFDPTPGRGGGASQPLPTTQPSQPTFLPPRTTLAPAPTPVQQTYPPRASAPPVGHRLPAAAGWALLATSVLATPPSAKALRARHRRRAPPREAILGAFDELVDRARDAGLAPRSSETHREFARRVGGGAALALAEASARALFGAAPCTVDEARTAWELVRQARREIRQTAPPLRRLLGALDPRTLVGVRGLLHPPQPVPRPA